MANWADENLGLLRLSQIDPNGLVPLLKKINRLEKCDAESTHFLQTAAKGGGLEEMGSLELWRRLAC